MIVAAIGILQKEEFVSRQKSWYPNHGILYAGRAKFQGRDLHFFKVEWGNVWYNG